MKKTLTALAIAAVFAACSSKPKAGTSTDGIVLQSDTATMNHNSFTDKGAVVTLNGVSDTIIGADGTKYVRERTNVPATNQPQRVVATPVRSNTYHTSHTSNRSSTSSTSAGSNSQGLGTTNAAPVVAKKKGWSNTLKGAVIGAGSGAVAGALIDKNKVQGAVIGGLAGAGGGFVVGKLLDKKAAKNQ